MYTCGSAPCPVCDATGTDWDGSRCRACEGTKWFPFPWTTDDDDDMPPVGRHSFTSDESAIILAAPTVSMARIGLYQVYGATVSRDSIRWHRRYCLTTGYRPPWSDRMEAIVDAAPSVGVAIMRIRETCPESDVTDKAIEHRWRLQHAPPPRISP